MRGLAAAQHRIKLVAHHQHRRFAPRCRQDYCRRYKTASMQRKMEDDALDGPVTMFAHVPSSEPCSIYVRILRMKFAFARPHL